MNDRREQDAAIADLHRRLDEHEKLMRAQDDLMREVRDTVLATLIVDAAHKAALEEMLLLWRGSKIMVPALVVVVGALWGSYAWLKDHIRL